MTTIINANEMGLLFINGALKKILGAGKYFTTKSRQIELFGIENEILPEGCTIDQLLKLPGAAEHIVVEDVQKNEICAHVINGSVVGWLATGKHAFWRDGVQHSFRSYRKDVLEVPAEAVSDIEEYKSDTVILRSYIRLEVGENERARLYVNGKLEKLLGAGLYYFWVSEANSVRFEKEDMRERKLAITGQEILSADKVGLRVNFTAFYRVTDAARIAGVAENIEEYLYSAAQLVLREYISKYKMDEILENRERISDEVISTLRERTANAYVEITSAGIRDIILPGEIAAIMNSVLAAEKRAQANVITRREEVASTRSLLNTAKLMDENATLRKLKELEYLERICENVGGITVDGSRDLLTQLASVVTGSQG